jgi:peptidoglycan L-alanyl-D-glutamate endopeptidase CwlK
MTSRAIEDLCPELQSIYREWVSRCHAANLAVKVICTWRSGTDQNVAFANGKSKAKSGQSPHNCCKPDGTPDSKAWDFAVFDEHAKYITDGSDHRYTKAGEIGEDLGLTWGGRFKSIFDPGHLELKGWKTEQAAPVTIKE